jgi:membrane protein implicated in regulation of membrane protease activity
MARPNGVVIVSEHYWAFAGVDGSLREGRMPTPPELLQRIPLARGLVRLYASLAPLFKRDGVAKRHERWLIVTALVAPLGLAAFSGPWSTIAAVALSALLVASILRGRTLHLHGAEHRAIAAAEERRLAAAWEGSAQPSRFSARCGTNFAALAIPVTFGADQLLPLGPALWSPLVVLVLSLALTMELWRLVQRSTGRRWRAFLLPGLALQRVTTREPRLDETQIALRAVAAVIRLERA